jgi:hypothetical protein
VNINRFFFFKGVYFLRSSLVCSSAGSLTSSVFQIQIKIFNLAEERTGEEGVKERRGGRREEEGVEGVEERKEESRGERLGKENTNE